MTEQVQKEPYEGAKIAFPRKFAQELHTVAGEMPTKSGRTIQELLEFYLNTPDLEEIKDAEE